MNALDYVTKDLWLARYARDQMGIPNQERIARLEKRLAQLQAERSQQFRDEVETLRRFEKRQGVTRSRPSLLVPMTADEHTGIGDNHGYLMEGGKRTFRL